MDLPTGIVSYILSRLPIKTIVHCKCVCKRWRIILSEPYFVNLHLSRSPKGLIVHRRKRATNIFKCGELDDKFYHHDIINHDPLKKLDLGPCSLTGSVNGLICLNTYHDDALHICNPVTREYIILSGVTFPKPSITNIITHSFGFVEANNQYKVVTLYLGSNKSECKIYTLGTGAWRSLGHLPFFVGGLQDGRVGCGQWCGTFVAGNLHWLAYQNSTHNEMIYTFDLEKELFQLSASAPRVKGDITLRSLGLLGRYLCICDSMPDSELVVIWMMKESWSKEIVIESTYTRDVVQPIKVLRDGRILLVAVYDCLFTYHPEYKTLQPHDVFKNESGGSFMDSFDAMVYVPSFIRLKSFTEEKVSLF